MNAFRATAPRCSLSLLMLMLPLTVQATDVTWPAATAPCNATLQACVDGLAAGSTIRIAANEVTAIGAPGSALFLPRPIALEPAAGYRPVFPVGVGISADPLTARGTSAASLRLSGITLRDAAVTLRVSRVEASTIVLAVERMRFLVDHGNGSGAAGIDYQGRAEEHWYDASHVTLEINDNEYVRRGGSGSFLRADVQDTAFNGYVSFNRIRIPDSVSSDYGIQAIASGGSAFGLVATRNDIRGSFSHGAICAVSKGPLGHETRSYMNLFHNVLVPTTPGVGTAICVEGGEDAFDMNIAHNTIVDFATAISMKVRPGPAPGIVNPVWGFLEGNLLAHNGKAWVRDALAAPPLGDVSNRNNLLYANGINFAGSAPATVGLDTLFTNPGLYSRQYPYLLAGSPAIGRGRNLSWCNGFPGVDAAGSRRLKDLPGGGPNVIDIGAYEYGDNWFNVRADAGNTTGNSVSVSHASLNGIPAANLFTTPNFSRGSGGAESSRPFGVYYATAAARWAVFNQDMFLGMPVGAGYSLMTPVGGSGVFLHRVPTPAPVSAEAILNDVAVNALPNSVLVLTPNWNPGGAAFGVYNNHNIAVAYGSDSRWRIRNGDGASFAAGIAFNVYALPPSPSAFRHVARTGNIRSQSVAAADTLIENPRLDNTPCAELMVTPLASFGNRRFDVYFDVVWQRWSIYSPDGMPEGAEFNVVFSPRQILECMGSLP